MPHETAVATPVLMPIVATPGLLDAHVAVVVMLLLLWGGEYTASAVSGTVCPTWGMVGLLGKRVIDCSTGGGGTVHETVSCVWPTTPWYSAVMVVVPQPTAVARLGLSGVSNIAIATLLDAHVTRLVRSVLLDGGEYTPSAMNWAVSVTWGMVGLLGKRVIDCSTGGPPPPPKHVLVNPVCPTMLPSCALIVVVPQPTAVARPVELMVATLELLDDQVTVERSSGGRLWFVVPIA